MIPTAFKYQIPILETFHIRIKAEMNIISANFGKLSAIPITRSATPILVEKIFEVWHGIREGKRSK